MLITRTSILTGKDSNMEISMSEEQYNRWKSGNELIQVIFPDLSPEEREFLITGMSLEEQKKFFVPPDDEEEEY